MTYKNTWTKGTALVLVAALVTMGMVAFAVTAGHEKEKTSKDDKTTYVGLGIGDHVISCPFPINVPPVDEDDDPTPLGEDLENWCLGGAVGNISIVKDGADWVLVDENGDEIGWWEIWAHDLVWGAVHEHAGAIVDPKVAGFAYIEIEVTQEVAKDDPESGQLCVIETVVGLVDEWNDVDVCTQLTAKTSVKRTHQFGFCGQAAVEIDQGAIDPKKLDKDFEEENVTATKVVFLDGPVFFQLDCPVTEDPIVEGLWSTVAETVNMVTCYQDQIPVVGDDDLNNTLGCPISVVDELPAGSSSCYTDKQGTGSAANVGVIAIAGDIGWQYYVNNEEPPEEKCKEENVEHGGWTTLVGGRTIEIKNNPLDDE